MYTRTTLAGLPRLLAATLLALSCSETISPGDRGPGAPSFWPVEPPPPPPTRTFHLDFTGGQPTSGQLSTLPGCVQVPLGLSTITARVTVVDDLTGLPATDFVGAVTVVIGENAAKGTLCGTQTVDVVGGVANFVDLGVDQTGKLDIGEFFALYRLEATGVATSGEPVAPATSDLFCVGECIT